MDINTPPTPTEPKYSKKRAIILTLIGTMIVVLGGALIIFLNNFDKIFPMLPEKTFTPATYERTLVGSPPMDMTYSIGEKENPIFGHLVTIETAKPITEEQAVTLEKAVDGIFCGGSAYSNTYFLCLKTAASNLEEYGQKIKTLGKYDFVTGIGPSSSKPIEMVGSWN